MRLIDIAVERRVTVLMFTVAVILFGFVALTRLKVNLLPDLSYPTLTIRTELEGAAPIELESLITRPIEEAVGIIRNVRSVRSVSRPGQSDVVLEFLWGTNMDYAAIEVREKIDLLELPLEAERPVLLRFDPASEPIMRLALLGKDPGTPDAEEIRLRELRRFAEDRLKNDFESVEGSAAVKVSGGYEDEIQVLVDQQKLAQLGLSIETVANRLRAENVNLSGGRLEQGSERFLVRTLNEFTSVGEMADAVIATFDGQPVYLKDVARVERGYKDREAITRINGREAIELAIYKEGDANTVQVAADLRAARDRLEKTLPEGTELALVYDQSRFISAAIDNVKSAAMVGGLLAIMVLYFFLRDARATFVIGVAIPVSVIGTFMLMYSADVTLNIMSLGGIALAVGMLVDNAVVVLENIVSKREQGLDSANAATLGTKGVATAVAASTITTVAVFFPMVFVQGVAGQLFRDQALTVTFALLFSLVLALTLVPMLAAGPRRAQQEVPLDSSPRAFTRGVAVVLRGFGVLWHGLRVGLAKLMTPGIWLVQTGYRSAARIYEPTLEWALEHRLVVVLAAIAAFGSALAVIPHLGTELIPQLSQGELIADIRLAPGTPLAQTDASVAAAGRAAMKLDNVALSYSVAGTGNRLDANPVDAGENSGKLNLTLAPGSGRETEESVLASLRQDLGRLPGVEYQFSRPSLFDVATPIEVMVSGYDLGDLRRVAEAVRARMSGSEFFRDIETTVEAGNPEIQIVFDQERAARLGLVVRDVADRVVASVRGEVATRYTLRDKKIDVLVRSVDTRSASLEEVRNLIVNPGSARPIPLSSVADVTLSSGPAEIRRVNQERVAIISANLGTGDLGTAVARLDVLIASIALPPGVSVHVSGQSNEMRDSFRSLQFALLLAVFLVYLVMASQFESLVHPFVILLTVPLGLIGAVLALWITGTPINVVALIGVVMLAGIVVNNAIVLIDAVNQARAAGLEKRAAIRNAARGRLRPILITTLTTVLGLLPLALGIGEGAEIRAPMAITVIGGLVVATLFTLIVIPVVYDLLDRKRFTASSPVDAGNLYGASR
jgi:HAE1 family hydrophobic/amphiphilic exporter-1